MPSGNLNLMDPPIPTADWKSFFDQHAPRYLENSFAKNTLTEVSFILALFSLKPGATILDMGCGVGRHTIELAKRGFQVTGVDLSSGMLEQARRMAREAGAEATFVEGDATQFASEQEFDAAICLCEGGVGLISSSEDPGIHDQAIFDRIAGALKPGAPFMLTAMNGYAMIRQINDEAVEAGAFDPATMIAIYQDEWKLPEGPRTMLIRERLFIPPEMANMLAIAGFEVQSIYGGTAGEWGRRPLKMDEVEAMYVCRKLAEAK